MPNKTTPRWNRKAEIYRHFATSETKNKDLLDFSDKAKQEMFDFETYGKGNIDFQEIFYNKKINGYAYGKKMMDITISMWREDIPQGLLYKSELYSDGNFSHWWLKKVLKGIPQGRVLIDE